MTPLPEVPAPGYRRSYWLEEALAFDPGDPCPSLASSVIADTCVVGGGFCGLWTAYELTERAPGMRIALLESDICGGGASGRNGGFFEPSWHLFGELEDLFGTGPALDYARAIADEVAALSRWCDRHSADIWYRQAGSLIVDMTGFGNERHDEVLQRLIDAGEPDRIGKVGAERVTELCGINGATAGWYGSGGANVQPARLARALRRVLLERGVRIFESTEVVAIEDHVDRRAGVLARTRSGGVRAEHLVLGTGAWSGRFVPFRRTFVTAADHVVATEPIPDLLVKIGWTNGIGLANSKSWFHYLRTTADGRVVIGGGAGTIQFGSGVGRGMSHDERAARIAAAGLAELYPELEKVRFTHAWGGPMDMSASYIPFFQTLGRVHAGLGFSGHGLIATKLGGKSLASLVLGEQDRWSALPVVGPPVAKMPPEPLRYLGARAVELAMEAADRREAQGEPAPRFVESIKELAELPVRGAKRRRRSTGT